MSRSLKKGVYCDPKLEKKIKEYRNKPIKTWARSTMITPEMIGIDFLVHNGKEFIAVRVREEMVGHRLGEFAPTTRFQKHGGKMERELSKKEGSK
ncbi:MAG TPA: 30S ribosomal protein S19 [Candidatus Paceibacterota bacterium]|jgi:small subunit ribosomal protein S19|nr:30S ribosomal protein S19 [Candidatus Paceibacterota bacterium]